MNVADEMAVDVAGGRQILLAFASLEVGDEAGAMSAAAVLCSGREHRLLGELIKTLVRENSAVYRLSNGLCLACDMQIYNEVAVTLAAVFKRISQLTTNKEKSIFIAVAPSALGIPFAQILDPDVAVVVIPRGELSEVVLVHELAHAVLSSGNRFLDEGFADLASQGEGIEECRVHGPPLADLLTRDWSGDLQFRTAWDSETERRGLRKRARDVVGALMERSGKQGLEEIFSSIKASPDEVVAIVSMNLGMSLTEWDNRDTSELVKLEQRLAAAQVNRDIPALQGIASESFEVAICVSSWRYIDLGITAELSAARELLLRGDRVEPGLVTVTDQWFAKAVHFGLPRSRQLGLKAHREMLSLVAASNARLTSRASASAKRVGELLKAALQADPSDRDAYNALDQLSRRMRAKPDPIGKYAAIPSDGPGVIEGEPAIEVRGISYVASSGFSLEVDRLSIKQGERIALVGPNGSGKSTLLEVLLGLIPASGFRSIFGRMVTNAGVAINDRPRVGALLAQAPIQRSTTVSEAIRLVDAVFGTADEAVFAALDIEELQPKRVSDLSRGQYQRVMLYHALGHSPDLIILDEPSLGLDARLSKALRSLLYGRWGESRTIIVCSHHPDDLETADRVLVMRGGRIRQEGSLVDLLGALDWTWKGLLRGVDTTRCAQLMRTLPDHKRSVVSGGELISFGGPAFGREFQSFASTQPFSEATLRRANIEDIIPDERGI